MNVAFSLVHNLAAIAEVNEESNPPDSNTPMGHHQALAGSLNQSASINSKSKF
jgi:hypothetical protein